MSTTNTGYVPYLIDIYLHHEQPEMPSVCLHRFPCCLWKNIRPPLLPGGGGGRLGSAPPHTRWPTPTRPGLTWAWQTRSRLRSSEKRGSEIGIRRIRKNLCEDYSYLVLIPDLIGMCHWSGLTVRDKQMAPLAWGRSYGINTLDGSTGRIRDTLYT